MGQCAGKEKRIQVHHVKKESRSRKSRQKKARKQQKVVSVDSSLNRGKHPVQEEMVPLSPKSSKAVMKKSSYGSDTSKTIATSLEAIRLEEIRLDAYRLDASHQSHTTDDSTHNTVNSSKHNTAYSDVSDVAEVAGGNDGHDDAAILLHARKDKIKSSPVKRMFNSPKAISGPRVLFKSPHNKHLNFRREKNNSTSSLYIRDTINSPNVDEILRCMSVALLYHIKNGMKSDCPLNNAIFSEKLHPLSRETLDLINLPDVNTVYRFVNLIFRVQRLPPECAILCLAYIEKILSGCRIVLHPENWRRLVFSSIIMATKIWEDESVWNVDFLDLFPLLTLIDLNNMENRFLELLEFNVIINGSEYAKYYFELRALSQSDSFPLEPLNKESQAALEERSQRTNAKVSKVSSLHSRTPQRSRSVDNYDPKSPTVVLQ